MQLIAIYIIRQTTAIGLPCNLPSDRSHPATSDSLCSRRKKLL